MVTLKTVQMLNNRVIITVLIPRYNLEIFTGTNIKFFILL